MALTKVRGLGLGTLDDNITFSTAGKGVHLGVTSATATNLLDDYEEGTWTPAFDNTSGFVSSSMNAIDARYTKIGRQVTLEFEFSANDNSGNVAAGDDIVLTAGCLPFTPSFNGHASGTVGVQAAIGTGENVAMGYIGLASDNKVGLLFHTVDGTVSRATALGGVATYFT